MKLLERIRKAYRKIRMKHCTGTWCKPGEARCCPLGAIAIEAEPSLRDYSSSHMTFSHVIRNKLRKTDEWIYGFTDGVDGRQNDYNTDAGYQAGYRAGQQIRKNLRLK